MADWLSRHPISPSLAPAIAAMSRASLDDTVDIETVYKVLKESSSLSNHNKKKVVLTRIGTHQQRRLLANRAPTVIQHAFAGKPPRLVDQNIIWYRDPPFQ